QLHADAASDRFLLAARGDEQQILLSVVEEAEVLGLRLCRKVAVLGGRGFDGGCRLHARCLPVRCGPTSAHTIHAVVGIVAPGMSIPSTAGLGSIDEVDKKSTMGDSRRPSSQRLAVDCFWLRPGYRPLNLLREVSLRRKADELASLGPYRPAAAR